MAAKLNAYFFHRAAGGKNMTASAGYFGVGVVLWVDILFHRNEVKMFQKVSVFYQEIDKMSRVCQNGSVVVILTYLI